MEIADRTLHLAFGNGTGTCFVFDHLGKQYLVTARHVVEGIKEEDIVQISANEKWIPIGVKLVGHSSVDVSVLAPSQKLAHPEMRLDPTIGNFYIGQEVFFAGFPLEMQGLRFRSPFPMPLLKRAVISGSAGSIEAGDPIYLDGHNNPGFSGAPVYFKVLGEDRFKVSMVVASYTATKDPVYDGSDNPTDMTVWSNSGIMAAYSIKEAINLIESNPIGFDLGNEVDTEHNV
jgi:hypothetical protein